MSTAVDISVREGETREQYRKRIVAEMRALEVEKRKKFSTGEIPVVMDVDDFGFLMPGHDDLLRLKKSFPDFKITGFTIPMTNQFFYGGNHKHFSVDKYKKWAEMVNACEWIEVAVHGFFHDHYEMETSYKKAIKKIEAWENFFKEVGLKYEKIFKAPYWQYSFDAIMALKDKGYLIAIDRNHPRPVPEDAQIYIYNWSFEEPLPEVKILKGHGHFTGQNTNNISAALPNILHHLPYDSKFITISEYHATYGSDTIA